MLVTDDQATIVFGGRLGNNSSTIVPCSSIAPRVAAIASAALADAIAALAGKPIHVPSPSKSIRI